MIRFSNIIILKKLEHVKENMTDYFIYPEEIIPDLMRAINIKISLYRIRDMYSSSCDRHQGDLELWARMDRRGKKLEQLTSEIKNCGACDFHRYHNSNKN